MGHLCGAGFTFKQWGPQFMSQNKKEVLVSRYVASSLDVCLLFCTPENPLTLLSPGITMWVERASWCSPVTLGLCTSVPLFKCVRFWIQVFFVCCISWKYLFLLCGLLFYSFNGVFDEKKCLILM